MYFMDGWLSGEQGIVFLAIRFATWTNPRKSRVIQKIDTGLTDELSIILEERKQLRVWESL
jgi:hypothetical protein